MISRLLDGRTMTRRRNYTQKPMSMPETRRIAGSRRPMENRAALTMRRVRRSQEVLVERKISLLVDCCATRLRCSIENPELVDEKLLKATGAVGVVKRGQGIQVIYGPQVTVIKSNLEAYLAQAGGRG